MAAVEMFNNGGSIATMLAQQSTLHLAGGRLGENPKCGGHELIWVADQMLQQHRLNPASPGELYSSIVGWSYLIGLLIATLYKTTPGGAWWRISRLTSTETQPEWPRYVMFLPDGSPTRPSVHLQVRTDGPKMPARKQV